MCAFSKYNVMNQNSKSCSNVDPWANLCDIKRFPIPISIISTHLKITDAGKLTDSIAFSNRKISSWSKWSVPVLPLWRANAAAQALWILFTQFSNSTCVWDVKGIFYIWIRWIFLSSFFFSSFFSFIFFYPNSTGFLYINVSNRIYTYSCYVKSILILY